MIEALTLAILDAIEAVREVDEDPSDNRLAAAIAAMLVADNLIGSAGR